MIKVKKPVSRLTDATIFERGKNREICATIYPSGTLGLRLKGMKTEYFLQFSKLFMQAISHTAQNEKPVRVVRRVKRSCIF